MFMHEIHSAHPVPVILVVEDHNLLRHLFVAAFRDSHRVHTAATETEGWRSYLDHAPDLIFLDIGLPDGSGHALARRIKCHNPHAYVVMTTASDDPQDAAQACLNQIDGFIVKPFDKKMIELCIENYHKMRVLLGAKAGV
jgi:CheY-like chemotaxis protein